MLRDRDRDWNFVKSRDRDRDRDGTGRRRDGTRDGIPSRISSLVGKLKKKIEFLYMPEMGEKRVYNYRCQFLFKLFFSVYETSLLHSK